MVFLSNERRTINPIPVTEILGHTVLYKLPNQIPVTEILGHIVLYKLPNPIPVTEIFGHIVLYKLTNRDQLLKYWVTQGSRYRVRQLEKNCVAQYFSKGYSRKKYLGGEEGTFFSTPPPMELNFHRPLPPI